MKKTIIAMAFAALALTVSAQEESGYNRLGVSYNNEHYGFNKHAGDYGVGLNGFGVDYIRGFHITDKPLYLETGLNFNYNFGSKSGMDIQDMNFQLPVNLGYRFGIGENMSLQPYVGLNFKLHAMSRTKYEGDEDWANLFDKDDVGDTWNRFQMGWHVGVGFNWTKYYLGVQWGTDFIPAFKEGSAKVNSSSLKVSLGYTF